MTKQIRLVKRFFLTHYDFLADPKDTTSLPPGPTGLRQLPDMLVRISRAPVVSIAMIRGRATGVGSELALASDMRFASREKAVMSQWEVGAGLVPGGGPMARLPRLMGRGRALEVLLGADDEAIFAGIPVNVTLLFSHDQYLASAEAFLRGVERRIDSGLNPDVGSVASLFISRWDTAVAAKVPAAMQNQFGIAVGKQTFKTYRSFLASERWQRAINFGARPQRLLFASTGTKDPKASDILYVKALAAPFTVNTMPENTLKAFGDHGEMSGVLAADGGDAETVLAQFTRAGIDIPALAARLQDEGAKSFVKSWEELMGVIETKSDALKKAS